MHPNPLWQKKNQWNIHAQEDNGSLSGSWTSEEVLCKKKKKKIVCKTRTWLIECGAKYHQPYGPSGTLRKTREKAACWPDEFHTPSQAAQWLSFKYWWGCWLITAYAIAGTRLQKIQQDLFPVYFPPFLCQWPISLKTYWVTVNLLMLRNIL